MIKVSKENPVYTLENDWVGTIGASRYKMWTVGDLCGDTFEVSYIKAVESLHNRLEDGDYNYLLLEYPKSKFTIHRIDGSLDKYGEVKREKVYSLSVKQIKKLFK